MRPPTTPAPTLPCRPGTFGEGRPNCKKCPVGTFSAKAGSEECSPCAGNSISIPSRTKCRSCPAGRTANDSKSRCSSQPCRKGFFGTGGSDCRRCPTGSVSSRVGSSECRPCIGNTVSSATRTRCRKCRGRRVADDSKSNCIAAPTTPRPTTTKPTTKPRVTVPALSKPTKPTCLSERKPCDPKKSSRCCKGTKCQYEAKWGRFFCLAERDGQ